MVNGFMSPLRLAISFAFPVILAQAEPPPPWPVLTPLPPETAILPNTAPLTGSGDLSKQVITAAHAFLDRQLTQAAAERSELWARETGAPALEARRQELREMLGLTREPRSRPDGFEYHDVLAEPRAVAAGFRVHPVRWRAFGQVFGTGLLLEPKSTPVANVIALPDAGQTPEEWTGLPPWDAVPLTPPVALQLAAAGCRVLVPRLVSRQTHPQWAMSLREWLHRPAYELGRTLTGYELLVVLSAADRLDSKSRPLGLIGWGEGGRLALFAAALDPRFHTTCSGGSFGPRQELWKEPADHNLFGFLRTLGDAELAALTAPRNLLLEHHAFPKLPPIAKSLGKPGAFTAPTADQARQEFARAQALRGSQGGIFTFSETQGDPAPATVAAFLAALAPRTPLKPVSSAEVFDSVIAATDRNWAAEQQSQFVQDLERHNADALTAASLERTRFFANLNPKGVASFLDTIPQYRDYFRTRVIGEFAEPLSDPAPRSRPYLQGPETVSYEVTLQVFPDLFAYGILTLPKKLNLAKPDRRPVVVCQHGLEGKPQDVLSEAQFQYYQAFATRLAERGYVTFAPQNHYLGFDEFRSLQFKANSVGRTLFSLIIPAHRQITEWLASLPFVDPEKIAFYGLSYGGKSAMRIPPLVESYALSICSGDFNDWIWKCAATDVESLRYSYANKGEYEIFEFNLGNTFNYAEMAALIAPRPFMVERGHFDGVSCDYRVGGEYAKVRNLYAAQLGIPERTEIEWFPAGHMIHAQGTYQFLDLHLGWDSARKAPARK